MMHTGGYYEYRARQERALALRQAWHGLRHLLRRLVHRPRPANHRHAETGRQFSAGCALTG